MIGLSFGLAVDVKWKEGKSPAEVLRFVSKCKGIQTTLSVMLGPLPEWLSA